MMFGPGPWQYPFRAPGASPTETKKEQAETKICGLCGEKLGEKYYFGYTSTDPLIWAETCLKTRCKAWLKLKEKRSLDVT